MPKQIKDFDLKENIDGLEDLLIQDSDGLTKRIKASKLMDEIDLSNYYTRAEVNDLLSNIDMSIAMADYYNKEAIDNLLANKANASDIQNLATKEELNDKANTSHRHIQADILDLSVPTKTSQLTNDSGFIASIPEEYVTESELNAKGYLTEHQDIAGKADINHIHSYNDLLDKPTIPSLDGYATETYVTNKIAEANLGGGNGGGEVDLSGYATKDELETKADKTAIPTKTSQLTNDSGFLTSHQDVSGKADKTYVDNQLATKSDTDHTHSYNDLTDKPTIPSTTNLATKTELTNGLATKADKVHTHDQYLTEHQDLSDYALKTEIPTVPTKVSQLTNDKGYLTSVPSEYITETELTGKSYATKKELTDSLTTKSDTTHNHDTIYSKLNHTHSQYLTSVPSEYVTETELNDTISGLGSGTGNVSSDIIKSIMVVDALPEVEVEGVLYLVRGGTSTDTPTTPEEPTVTNLYPNQTRATTSDGFTITFTGRNVTIDGRNDTKSIQCQTNQFDMVLEANKTYYLKLTNVSGLFDDSKRVSQSDGMICMVALTVYDSSGKSKNLINWDERDARGIYEKFTFTPSFACVTGKLIIQAKKLTSFSNWTCSIVIAEEGV